MRLHVVVRGRVQGVGFRWFVREAGRHLDLAGWVRNRPDGCVEVAADGDAASIHALRRELQTGPDGASVKSVDDLDASAEPLPRPFTILR
jgi:acylphosphatase